MCGRYVSKKTADWERQFHIKKTPPFAFESYNIAPTQKVPVVRAATDGNTCELLRWGLIPFFARGEPTKYSTINARIETLETAASYRGPWKRGQRCLLLATGFYEWHVNDDGSKQPFYIHVADQESFGLAGLWDRSVAADGMAVESCTLITMPANPMMAEIHNAKHRMPAILAADEVEAWLSGSVEDAKAALKQYPEELMVAWPVSTRVNSPKNNGPELIATVR